MKDAIRSSFNAGERTVQRWAWARGDDDADPRIVPSFAAGFGFFATLTAAIVLMELRQRLPLNVDLGVMSGLVVVAGWWMAWTGVLVTAGLAWLMLNSFVVSHDATLRWHGSADLTRLIVLFGCAIAMATVRSLQLYWRQRREVAVVTEIRVFASNDLQMTGERHA
jgi:hypothetical protein